MAKVIRVGFIWWVGVTLFVVAMGVQGCAGRQKMRGGVADASTSCVDGEIDGVWIENIDERELWNRGLGAFRVEDYEMARVFFEALSKRAADENFRIKALYALACTRLLLAKDRDEFNAAMNLWDLWSQLAPPEVEGANPRMLTPFLRSFTLPVQPESAGDGSNGRKKPGKPVTKEVVKTVTVKDKECERLLRTRERDVEALRRQIGTLKSQIEALEDIHRKIQEKKELVSPP